MAYASDHRGQPLHAGKRTMDSMKQYSPSPYYDDPAKWENSEPEWHGNDEEDDVEYI